MKKCVALIVVLLGVAVSSVYAQTTCGGAVTTSSSSLTVADADRVAGALSKIATITFTTATALPIGGIISVTLPANYFSAGPTGTLVAFTPALTPTAVTLTSSTGASTGSISITTAGAILPPGAYTVTLGGMTIGAPRAGSVSTCTTPVFTVTTYIGNPAVMLDTTSTNYVAIQAIGGPVTMATTAPFVAGKANTAANAGTVAGTIKFTISTAIPAATTNLVYFSFPAALFATGTVPALVITVPSTATATLTACTQPSSTGTFNCQVGGTGNLAAADYTVTISNVATGAPAASFPTQVTVSTFFDYASTSASAGSLGSQIGAVQLTVPTPLQANLGSVTASVVFTPVTTIAGANSNTGITIYFPAGVFSAISAITTPSTGVTISGFTGTVLTLTTAVAMPGGTAVTIAFTSTLGASPMAKPCTQVSVATSSDLRSVITSGAPALGGQITLSKWQVSSTTPLAASQSLTVTFTNPTPLATGANAVVTFNYPSNYFTTGVTPTIGAGMAGTPTATTTNSFTVQLTTAIAAAQTTTVTFTGLTMGVPQAQSSAGATVSTSTDTVSAGLSTPALGGAVTLSSFKVSSTTPLLTAQSLTVTFTNPTALPGTSAGGNKITVNYPSGYFASGTGSLTLTGLTSATIGSTSATSVEITTTVALAAGATTTITIGGLTMGSPIQATTSCNGWSASVSTSTDSAGSNAPLSLGGVVSVTAFLPSSRVPLTASSNFIFTFTTQTVLAISQTLVLNFPPTFATGSAPTVTGLTASVAALQSSSVTFTATSIINPGTYTVTLAGLTMGNPYQPSQGTKDVSMTSSTDVMGTMASAGTLGGQVSNVVMTIATADRVASTTNRKVILAFNLQSALSSGAIVTVIFPTSFLINAAAPSVTSTSAGFQTATSSVLSTTQLTLTTSGNVAASASVGITLCGITIGSASTGNVVGIKVNTPQDAQNCGASGAISASMGTVTAVSMSIAWASRIATTAATSAVFSFTTATALVANGCGNGNTIVITTPSAFFTAAAANAAASGITGYTFLSFSSGVITLAGTGPLAAGAQTVTVTGLTTGAATAGSDTVTVSTTMDDANAGSPTGPLSGFMVTSAAVTSCKTGPCNSVVLSFLMNTAIASGFTLTVTFGPSFGVTSPSGIDVFNIGTALVTPSIAGKVVTLAVSGATIPMTTGTTAYTITINGLQFSANSLLGQPSVIPDVITVGSNSITSSTTWMPVYLPAISTGVATTNSLSIPSATPGAKNKGATATFTTATPLTSGSKIYVVYPTGFFTDAATVTLNCQSGFAAATATSTAQCVLLTGSVVDSNTLSYSTPPLSVWTLTVSCVNNAKSPCSIPAGLNTVSFSGLTLSATAQPSRPFFQIVTSSDFCSAGYINTGTINANNAPGANNGASGTSALIISMSAIVAALMMIVM